MAGFTITETLSGAFSLVLLPLLGWWLRRLILKYEAGHAETQAGQRQIAAANQENYSALEKRLIEAESLIRGDLANGVKATVDRIETKVDAQDVETTRVNGSAAEASDRAAAATRENTAELRKEAQ